jgi:hypothetical protein
MLVTLFDIKDPHASFDSCKKASVKELKHDLVDHKKRTLLKLWNDAVNRRADSVEYGINLAINGGGSCDSRAKDREQLWR